MQHQAITANKIIKILSAKGYAYLAGEPRSGKSLTAICTIESSSRVKSVLILCPPKAVKDWEAMLKGKEYDQSMLDPKLLSSIDVNITKKYKVLTYGKVGSMVLEPVVSKSGILSTRKKLVLKWKINPKDYDFFIIDESHSIGAFPKASNRTVIIQRLIKDKAHLHLSGTSITESPSQIYHQMQLGKYSPWKQWSTFYKWHKVFGEPYTKMVFGQPKAQYDKCYWELLEPLINKFTVYMTQEQAGINKELKAVDKVHKIQLDVDTVTTYNKIISTQYAVVEDVDGETIELIADSIPKRNAILHMLESGVAKVDDVYITLKNTEKMDYVYDTFGDTVDVGIMSNFPQERVKLRERFKHATIYSSQADAEGVDLSHLKHFVIISSGYSGIKHVQRRERIVNIKGSKSLTVNHIVASGAMSSNIYKVVQRKHKFNMSLFSAKPCKY